MWYTGRKIPTNLITGFLGTGKTTAIRELLAHRPAGERWSVFVNEYGMVSMDDLMFDNTSPEIQIQELAGGCFCCTTSGMLDTVLMQFIRRTRPDRLLIEPSGAGHPARVIDTLRSERFQQALDLRATICLVDPKDFENPRVTNSEGFSDQIQMSDVVAINWTDKRSPEQTLRCRQWIEQFDPPKLRVAEIQFGHLDPAWLDLSGTVVRKPRFENAHAAEHHHTLSHSHEDHAPEELISLAGTLPTDQPIRLENHGGGQRACGWIFPNTVVFDYDRLFDYLGFLQPTQRVKGIFQCADDWWLMNRKAHEVSITPTAYRRDSRLEIITDNDQLDWLEVETRLLSCIVRSQPTSTEPA